MKQLYGYFLSIFGPKGTADQIAALIRFCRMLFLSEIHDALDSVQLGKSGNFSFINARLEKLCAQDLLGDF